jgi:excisionase family DNA binding protein
VNLQLELKDIQQIAEAVAERINVPHQTRWLTRQEAADRIRCSTKHLDQLVRLGDVPVYRPNRRPLFSADDLDRYITDRKES